MLKGDVWDTSRHPPGPNDSWLGETLAHSEDIRRPLGIAHGYPTDAAVQGANFYKGSNLLIGFKTRIAGLMLRATSASTTRHAPTCLFAATVEVEHRPTGAV